MTYDEFKKQLIDGLQKAFKGEDILINIQDVIKNNDHHLDALCITKPDSMISPNIYIQSFYDQYLEGDSLQNVVNRIKHIAVCELNHLPVIPEINRDSAMNNLFATVVGLETNREMLADVPHRIVEDLAIIPRFKVDVPNAAASFVVKNTMLSHLHMTKDEVLQIALANTEKQSFICRSMTEVLKEMLTDNPGFGEEGDISENLLDEAEMPLYVVTNSDKSYGATAMICRSVMQQVREQIGEECYILPSSVHECLLIPKSQASDLKFLQDMVYEVNRTTVTPEEFLSDSVYTLHPQTMKLQIANEDTLKEQCHIAKSKSCHM